NIYIFGTMNTQTDIKKKTKLKALTKEELQDFSAQMGLESYRSDQLFQWLYQKGVHSFDEMTNLSKDLRAQLKEVAHIPTIEHVLQKESEDGTFKFMFELHNGAALKVESVIITDLLP